MSTNHRPTITICLGSSCFSRGNSHHLQFIQDYLQKNNLDAEVELSGSRCEGECVEGPNIRFDGDLYGGIDEEKLIALLDKYLRKQK